MSSVNQSGPELFIIGHSNFRQRVAPKRLNLFSVLAVVGTSFAQSFAVAGFFYMLFVDICMH